MEYKPIEKKKVYQTIIQQIKDSILNGSIQPGERLPSERSLAKMFGVSRTSVKEAITVLESSGIINIRSGVGMYINENSIQDLLKKLSNALGESKTDFIDLIEFRQTIEGDCAYYAALRITEKQSEELIILYEQLVNVVIGKEIALEEDYLFHYKIVEASNNPIMLEVFQLVSAKIKVNLLESREQSVADEKLNEEVIEEHKKIFDAIINNKPDDARKAMWKHHEGIKKRQKQLISNRGGIRQ